MQFWIRHILLLLLCLLLPAGGALYVDADRAEEQARIAGATAARLASQSLKQRLTLEAHRAVGQAIGVAQTLRDQGALDDLARNRAGAFEAAREALVAATPAGGFAWLLDAEGHVVVAQDMDAPPETPRSVAGHPIFPQTQLGFALDGFWTVRGPVVMVAAAPMLDQGKAAGAVLIGRQVDAGLGETLARDIEAKVTLVSGTDIIMTTLDEATAQEVVAATADALEPVAAGHLSEPMGGASLPFLPLFADPYAEGLAYSSTNVVVPGAPSSLRWLVSVRTSQGLDDLAHRQEVFLGVGLAAVLLALLIGLLNFRTFVTPIERVASHLSEIQLGRGDLELPESRVSKPFRRLVRLINMTVQKMPQRSMSSLGSATDLGPIQDIPARGQSGLHLSEPAPAPPAAQIPLPPPAPVSAPTEAPAPIEEPSLPPPPPVASELAEPSLPPPPPPPEPAPPVPMAPSMDVPPDVPAPPAAEAAAEQVDDDAIAAAIAALEQGTGPLPQTPPEAARRSASEIRGRAVSGEMSSPFEVEEGSQFGKTNEQVEQGAAGGVRGGGSLDLSGHAGIEQGAGEASIGDGDFNPEATVVAPVQEDLLARSAREDLTDAVPAIGQGEDRPDHTVVATVPPDLLAQSAREGTASDIRPVPRTASQVVRDETLDDADRAHFKEVYERFIEMRKRCGENTGDLAFDRFLAKLTRNRDNLIKKYACRTVRFQVYEKDGKAALKATPVRAR